jgi:hypothetical protein
MATTTPNNGWAVPTSTDYVKDGATAIETLGDAIDASVGTGLLAWTSWSPTLSGGWANGNGVWTAKYAKLGKTVHVQGQFVLGTTTTKGTGIAISLPVTAAAASRQSTTFYHSCAGSESVGMIYISSTTALTARIINVASTYPATTSFTSTTPGTWATGDSFAFALTYEAA